MVCQEKHMDSRAVALIDRDLEAARARFTAPGALGAVWTRTGRPFSLRLVGRPAAQSGRTACGSMPDALRLPN